MGSDKWPLWQYDFLRLLHSDTLAGCVSPAQLVHLRMPLVAFNFKCYSWPEAGVTEGNIKFQMHLFTMVVIHPKTTGVLGVSASVGWITTDAQFLRNTHKDRFISAAWPQEDNINNHGHLTTHHPEPASRESPCSWTHRWNQSHTFSIGWTRRSLWWWPSRPRRTPSSSL